MKNKDPFLLKQKTGTGRKRWQSMSAFFLILVLFTLFSMPASADSGPHPSVTVTVTNLPESVRYATLLADTESYGPYRALTEPGTRVRSEEAYSASVAFFEYAAQNGLYDWGRVFTLEDGRFCWGYFPPKRFIILLYDTDSGAVYTSAETERYAFDSFYRVTLLEDGSLDVERESQVFKSVHNVCVRLAATLLVELLIALLFGYRAKRELLTIVVTNVVTQALLNWYLIVDKQHPDTLPWFHLLLLLELAIFAGEAAAYSKLLRSHSKKRAVLYAITANTASLFAGALIGGILM